MKVSKKDLNLILVILGIVLAAVSYFAVYNGLVERTEKLERDLSALNPRLEQLRAHESASQGYLDGMEEVKASIAERTLGFDTHMRPEDWIMYAVRMVNRTGCEVESITVNSSQRLDPVEGLTLMQDSGEYRAVVKQPIQTTADIACVFTYEQLKQIIDYIYIDSRKTSLVSMNVTYNSSTGRLRGAATLNKLILTSPDDPYIETDVGRRIPVGANPPFPGW
jgi:hypothetical protein